MQISSLHSHPHFADSVADRGWREWWCASSSTLVEYRAGLDPMLGGQGIPQGFVAHEGETYLGSVLLIENDLAARPQFSPWIAALWVEPCNRRQGIAQQLMAHAIQAAHKLGHRIIYLCAEAEKVDYYSVRGWQLQCAGLAAD
jgi:GNAT superfamily N-acetyltransferase